MISAANFTLNAGSVTEQVTVMSDAVIQPQLDTSAAGTLIPSTKITQLSLSSRNFVQLVAIQPDTRPFRYRQARNSGAAFETDFGA